MVGLLIRAILLIVVSALVSGPGVPGAVAADGQNERRNDQTRSSGAVAPGSDAPVYIPGTTLDSVGDRGFFRMGRVRLRPSLRLSYFHESNLFATEGPSVSDNSYFVEPGIEALLPVGADGVRVSYLASYRNYERFELREKVSHFVNADSNLELTPVLSLAVRDHYARSILDSREFVPGREVVFSDAPFTRNDAETRLTWAVSETQSLALAANWNNVRFRQSDTSGALPFYDYDVYRAGMTIRRDLTNRTAVFVAGELDRTITEDPRGIADSRGIEGRAGMTSQLSPLVTGQFSVGFRSIRFPGARLQNYQGLVYRCDLVKEFTPSIRLSLAAFRGTYPSYYENNAFFKANGIGLTYSQDLGSALMISIRPGYQRNRYPLGESTQPGFGPRMDEILDLYVSARYRFSDWLAVEALYDYIRRHSIVAGLDFTDHRLGLSLILGQEAVTRGRTYY